MVYGKSKVDIGISTKKGLAVYIYETLVTMLFLVKAIRMKSVFSWFGVVALILSMSCSTEAANLVGHWPFDVDCSDAVGTNDGTAVGGASITSSSKVGSGALELDGVDGYVDLTGVTLSNAPQFSIAAWVYVDGLPNSFFTIFNDDGYETGDIHFALNPSMQGGLAFGGAGEEVRTTAAVGTTGSWVHLAVTRDQNTNTTVWWVDGVDVAMTGSLTASDPVTFGPAAIGAWDPQGVFGLYGVRRFADGIIDDLRVYDGVLNESEVLDIYGSVPIPVIFVGNDKKCIIDTGSASYYLDPYVETPAGAVINASWTDLSGPGTVDFSDPNEVDTQIYFDAVGDYVLQLTVDYTLNGETSESVSKTLTVSVLPEYYSEISRGHRIILEKGLQLQTWIRSPWDVNVQDYIDCGFNVPDYSESLFAADPNYGWAYRAFGTATANPAPGERILPTATQTQYMSNLNSIQFGDEEYYNLDNVYRLKDWYDLSHSLYPDAICHNNQWGSQWNYDQYRTYLEVTDVDMLTYDGYFFTIYGYFPIKGGSCIRMYNHLGEVRKPALEGHEGTGAKPILYGHYIQGFKTGNGVDVGEYVMTESQINLYYHCAWTYGAKWVSLFTWDGFFNLLTNPDGTRTSEFDYFQEANRQSMNLSYVLSRLVSTDVRIIPGEHFVGAVLVENEMPGLTLKWDSAADGYINAISAINLGTENNGLRGDLVIGYFEPVLDNFADHNLSTDNDYFMICNGLTSGDYQLPADQHGSADETKQRISVELEVAPDNVLRRVSRDTGAIEDVPLTLISGNTYEFDVDLGGGLADLFILTKACSVAGDLTGDCTVNILDLNALAEHWLDTACSYPLWCEQADVDESGKVDYLDFKFIADEWLN